MTAIDERSLVFNVVWTGSVFDYLRLFVASQIDRSSARFRFVANGCPADQIKAMEAFASAHPDRVVEVLDVSEEMVAHGVALDRVRAQRDDGLHFCLIDPDIKANGSFVEALTSLMAGPTVAVTSGKEVWSDDNLVPPGHKGVAGEHFFGQDGFVFGSPHLAIYQRDVLDETCARWGIGMQSAGPDLSPSARAALQERGHDFVIWDTAKIVNVFLQVDGGAVAHRDLDELVHIGGLSHYLSPSGYITGDEGQPEPEWTRYRSVRDRFHVTRYTAQLLRQLIDGGPPPVRPPVEQPAMQEKLDRVQTEVTDLVARYATW
jgi:hypothetical protein